MQYNRNYNFTAGTEIVADQVDLELDSIASVLNTGIDTANIVDNAVTTDKMASNINPETRAAEIFVDGVYSGLTISPTSGWSNLVASITAGTSYIRGRRVSTTTQADHTFTASKDTYVDVDKNMNFSYPAVSNGAAEPPITANSLRIMKVVTDGTKITAWYDRRPWQWIEVGYPGGPAFESSWTNYDLTNWGKVKFMKDQIGMVHIEGMIKSGSPASGSTVFTLPPGFRPACYHRHACIAYDALSNIEVRTGGGIYTITAHATWSNLGFIVFKAEN